MPQLISPISRYCIWYSAEEGSSTWCAMMRSWWGFQFPSARGSTVRTLHYSAEYQTYESGSMSGSGLTKLVLDGNDMPCHDRLFASTNHFQPTFAGFRIRWRVVRIDGGRYGRYCPVLHRTSYMHVQHSSGKYIICCTRQIWVNMLSEWSVEIYVLWSLGNRRPFVRAMVGVSLTDLTWF